MANDDNVNVTITLPRVVHEKWVADKNRKGLIAKLVAEYYGYEIKPSQVVLKQS